MEKGVHVKAGRKRLIYTLCYSKGEFWGMRRKSTWMITQIITSAVFEKKECVKSVMLAAEPRPAGVHKIKVTSL